MRIYSFVAGELELKKELPQPSSQPSTLSFSHDGKSLAVGFASGKITVYDTASWEPSITRWSAHTGRVSSIAWREGDTHAASGALDTHVFVWSVDKPGSRVSVSGAHKDGVNAVAWADGETVLSGGADGAVKVWTVAVG